MTTETAVAVRSAPRDVALLKAIGFDRLAPEQRELALSIADRYGLDPMLRHIVLIDGRPYITRDALLHIAHRSGVFDGMEVSTPTLDGDFWRATCSVYRKDMSRPFTYGGRYPVKGKNPTFAPEMAVKVAEVMALRRAFDVSAPVQEERWDRDEPGDEPEQPARQTLAERAAAKAAAVSAPEPEVVVDYTPDEVAEELAEVVADALSRPLSRGEFNRRAVAVGLTKGDVEAAAGRLGLPGPTDRSEADYGALAADLGLA